MQTPVAEASSPAYRCTNPGMSPLANSVCTRSSNSRIVRIVLYACNSRCLVNMVGGTFQRAIENVNRDIIPARSASEGDSFPRLRFGLVWNYFFLKLSD